MGSTVAGMRVTWLAMLASTQSRLARGGAVVLLRKVIGDALRARRLAQHRTLREVSTAANVSLGYLSEIERGHKEASSELLGSICDALGARLSEMLTDVAATFALAEQMDAVDRGADRRGPRVEPRPSAAEPSRPTRRDVSRRAPPRSPTATSRCGCTATARCGPR